MKNTHVFYDSVLSLQVEQVSDEFVEYMSSAYLLHDIPDELIWARERALDDLREANWAIAKYVGLAE